MKKDFEKCNNSVCNSDIYNEVVNFDMFSYDELMKKSVIELEAMLADDTIFPLDETANAEIIERICDVIIKNENVPNKTVKAEAKKSWRSFRKKYIKPHVKTPLVLTETVQVKKPQRRPYVTVFTALAAAAIIILAVRIPARLPSIPEATVPITESNETTAVTQTTGNFVTMTISLSTILDGFAVEATGTIIYDDNSKKTYNIYSSGDRMFFISVLTNISDDIYSPSENQLAPYDIFTHANIDDRNIQNGNEVLITQTAGNTQIIICGDITDEEAQKISLTIATDEDIISN
jgi:hypothetical protein